MSVVSQLFQLQQIDQSFDSNKQAIGQINARLGPSQQVDATRQKLALEQERLAKLRKEQAALETEISDLTAKIAATEKDLYGGRITNPKELTSLQQEIEMLKRKRFQIEENVLQIMAQLEQGAADSATAAKKLELLELAWQAEQKQLADSLRRFQAEQAELAEKRQSLVSGIDQPVVAEYERLRKHKGSAVARVEQGICQGCRIALPAAELRELRADKLAYCGSCGRILFQI